MQVKDSTRQRIHLYLDDRDPDDKAILDHLEGFTVTRRTSAEVRRLILLGLQAEGGIARRPMGLAPVSLGDPGPQVKQPSGTSTRRSSAPKALPSPAPSPVVDDTPSTPEQLASASGNFINMFG